MSSCKAGCCILREVYFSDSSSLQLPSYRGLLQLTDVVQIRLMQTRDFCVLTGILQGTNLEFLDEIKIFKELPGKKTLEEQKDSQEVANSEVQLKSNDAGSIHHFSQGTWYLAN